MPAIVSHWEALIIYKEISVYTITTTFSFVDNSVPAIFIVMIWYEHLFILFDVFV
jgi:hypothetical protein